MKASLITAIDELAGIEAAWWDLFVRVPQATAFASPAWLLPWWRTFAPGQLSVIALWDRDRLVGLAPLYIEDGALGRRLLPIGIGVSDMLDILLDPAYATAAGALLGQALGEVARCECWSAEEAPPDAAVLALADPPGWRSSLDPQSACPVLALPASGMMLREVIPARKWRKWQMARNRAARRACGIEAARPDTLEPALAHLFRLHGARWQSKGEVGVLADDLVRCFHTAAAPALQAAGLLRLTLLRLDGIVAGACSVLCHGATACAYLGGFDPAFAFESPGTLLIGDAIMAAARDGRREFSFLRGREPYKYEWGAVDRWNQRRRFAPAR